MPVHQAIKLLRILSTRNYKIAADLVNRYNIVDTLASYLTNESFSLNGLGLKLQIESLYLWASFVHYNLGLDVFTEMQPILLQMLNFHVQNTGSVPSTSYIIQGHVASLLNLLAQVCMKNNEAITPYIALLVDPGILKWTSQLTSTAKFSCGKLQILTSALNCFTQLYKSKPGMTDLAVGSTNTAVKNMLGADGFLNVTENIAMGSNLLKQLESHKSNANLQSVEAAVWDSPDHIVPTLHTNSCIPFLCALSRFLVVCNDYKLKLYFLQHHNIQNYLISLRSQQKYSLTSNWFTRVESELVLSVLKLAITVQADLDTSLFYELAVKTLNIFTEEQKSNIELLLQKIIFCPKFYPSEVLIQNLNIKDQTTTMQNALANLNNIFEVYSSVLGLKQNVPDFSTKLCLDFNIGNIIPIDWVYSPIILLYSKQQENNLNIADEKQVFIITNCLRWICIYETYFPSLAVLTNGADRYCRIACVLIASDDLFLNAEVHALLQLCFKHILEIDKTDINFDKPMQGLSNFQDLYTQLLEQYQGVSYGDVLFGNFVLMPLAQLHDVKYRKILWSEYAGIVQVFNVTPEQCLLPMEIFLSPPEVDVSLLKCYRRAVISGAVRKNSVLYYLAKHHVEYFLSQRISNKSDL